VLAAARAQAPLEQDLRRRPAVGGPEEAPLRQKLQARGDIERAWGTDPALQLALLAVLEIVEHVQRDHEHLDRRSRGYAPLAPAPRRVATDQHSASPAEIGHRGQDVAIQPQGRPHVIPIGSGERRRRKLILHLRGHGIAELGGVRGTRCPHGISANPGWRSRPGVMSPPPPA